ncbi:MAG: hypothetical protein K2M14_08300, partial [Muribaculaceae bacterium]|nr:hypothetical protein [Muribaculaceae bacterium]
VATLTLTGRDLAEPVTVRLEGDCKEASVEFIQIDADARFFSIDGTPLPGKPQMRGIYIMVCKSKTLKYIVR